MLTVGLGLVHAGLWGVLLANLVYLRRNESGGGGTSPSVSVCIPARNEAKNLRRLLPTLLSQRYPDLEIIVWDDGSEDATWDVLQSVEDERLRAFHGSGPAEGWVGKVHALYQCTRRASGEVYLFLDADAALADEASVRRLLSRHEAAPTRLTSGLPALRGAAQLLVSLVPYALLTGLPWPLVSRTQMPSMSALNGQCWMIDAALYHEHEPHEAVRDDVLEDVGIGRYLKRQGHPPTLLDVQREVAVYMYDSFGGAWRGFRKNAYLLLGGRPLAFVGGFGGFLLMWIVAPLLSGWFLASLYGLKLVTDRLSGFPLRVTGAAPLSFVLGLALQLDSALHHWTRSVQWKGRSVASAESS
jgi:glycosyltransferase involved in cell wall biosynthesis